MAAVSEIVAGVLEEAAGLGAPGAALVALVGVAVVGGVPRARPLAKGAIKGYLTVKGRASEGFFSARERASEGYLSARERAGGARLTAREGATAWLAEIRETLQDTYAEAKQEYTLERAAANGAEGVDVVEPTSAERAEHPTEVPLAATHPGEHDAPAVAVAAPAAAAHEAQPAAAVAAPTAGAREDEPAPEPTRRPRPRRATASSDAKAED